MARLRRRFVGRSHGRVALGSLQPCRGAGSCCPCCPPGLVSQPWDVLPWRPPAYGPANLSPQMLLPPTAAHTGSPTSRPAGRGNFGHSRACRARSSAAAAAARMRGPVGYRHAGPIGGYARPPPGPPPRPPAPPGENASRPVAGPGAPSGGNATCMRAACQRSMPVGRSGGRAGSRPGLGGPVWRDLGQQMRGLMWVGPRMHVPWEPTGVV